MNNLSNLPRKWTELRPEDVGRLEEELARETCTTHPLYGAHVRALFRKYPQDDVLFEVFDLDYPYYCVHLTWRPETNPDWPSFTRFRSLEDFCSNYQMTLGLEDEDPNWPLEKWRFYESPSAE